MPERPSLRPVRTLRGFGVPGRDGLKGQGWPLGVEDARKTKETLGWPVGPPCLVPAPALDHFREALGRGETAESAWHERLAAYAQAFPPLARKLPARRPAELPKG